MPSSSSRRAPASGWIPRSRPLQSSRSGDSRARRIFASIGAYLAHTLKLYCRFYDVHHMIVLGRVMSGLGGSVILETCLSILNEEYPELAQKVRVMLPDEKTRRVGQSVAAASLPELRKNA